MKKIIISIATLLTILLVACSSGEQKTGATQAPAFPVGAVNQVNTSVYNEYPATVEGATEVEIRPQVGGILERIYVDEGAYVNSGQSLFKINDNIYREKYNNAQAELLSAQAAAANAQLEIDKMEPLVQNKVMSDIQLKTLKTAYAMAAARVQQAQANVTEANINLGYTLIKAPVQGYIGRLNKKAGSLLSVTDATELTTLSNIKEVHVYFSLSEREFSELKEQLTGKTIEEKLQHAGDVTLMLTSNKVYPEVGKLDIVNGGFDKNSGAITIRASFPNTNGLLRSGNTGKIRLGFEQKDVISIPQAATTRIQDKVFVFTVGSDNKVHKQAISVSGTTGNNFLVKEGLKPGDKIVLEGIETLQEGMAIQPSQPAVAQAK